MRRILKPLLLLPLIAAALAAVPRLIRPLPPPEPVPTEPAAGPTRPPATRPADVLRRQGVEPDVAGVLGVLRQWRPDEATQVKVANLVLHLAVGGFAAREKAAAQLADYGPAAVGPLREAAKSDDPELSSRARDLLAAWDKGDRRRDVEDRLSAVLAWLTESPAPAAVPVLLDVLPALPEPWDREAAAAALWACAGPADADALRKAVAGGDPAVRAAAIPALEAVSPADAAADVVELLKPFLDDKDDRVRLAAARALVDRRPKESAATLLSLLASTDASVRSQAAWLLQQLTGLPADNDPAAGDFAAMTKRWREWAASPDADHPAPVGRKRLELARFGAVLAETFAEAKADVTGGYHAFRYEAFAEAPGGFGGPGGGPGRGPAAPAVGWAAAVKDGVLRFDGHHPEGDQRLYVTADRLLGLPAFPARFRIKTKLGGEADGAGVWHVGVSVGNVRVLFHPAYPGGGFRVERVDNHKFLVPNQTMPFQPAGGALYDMTIDVRRLDGGAARLDVAIDDGAGKRFEKSITVDAADVGELSRIGLERSGRTGGAALFGAASIDNVSPGAGKAGG